MRAGRRAATALAAVIVAGCASSPSASPDETPPPSFTRSWGAWAPEEMNGDVVQCAEAARVAIAGEDGFETREREELRRALREATTKCMLERGWELAAPERRG